MGKTGSYNGSNYVIPKEEDLISLCLEEDRLWMLAVSPHLTHIALGRKTLALFEGSLSNINHLLNRKELLMNEEF